MAKITGLNEIIEKCFEPDIILGATNIKGQIAFLMKWKNNDKQTMITSNTAKELFPQLVIEFYERNLVW